jgi:hypothetical protein
MFDKKKGLQNLSLMNSEYYPKFRYDFCFSNSYSENVNKILNFSPFPS